LTSVFLSGKKPRLASASSSAWTGFQSRCGWSPGRFAEALGGDVGGEAERTLDGDLPVAEVLVVEELAVGISANSRKSAVMARMWAGVSSQFFLPRLLRSLSM
jgi:hypothetical protein